MVFNGLSGERHIDERVIFSLKKIHFLGYRADVVLFLVLKGYYGDCMDVESTVLLMFGIKGEVRMVVLVRREGVVERR